MVQPTTPDNIVRWDNNDPTSLVEESQKQGDSIQAALNKRQRFDYVWANDVARTSQTGMTQGSRGYQLDTKSEYIYDNSQWRLAIPYAEFTQAGKSIPAGGVYTALSPMVLDTGASTSSTFVTPGPTDGTFIIVDPGVYGFSLYGDSTDGIGLTGQSHIVVSSGALAAGTQYTRGYFTGGKYAMCPMPFIRITAANTLFYTSAFQETGVAHNVASRMRIGRFG